MAEAGPPRIPAFLSFSGGGAKGIAHVGAWYAVAYRDEFALRGVSGTSAGALIAALVAAGYRPGEVYDPADTRDGGPLMRTIRSFNEGRDGLRARFGRTVDALPDIFQLSDGPFVRRPMRWLLYGISR